MEERTYTEMLSTYRKGVDCILTYTSKKRGEEISREIRVDEVTEGGKLKPVFRFRDSNAIVDPRQIGGFEKIAILPLD